jgi:hypothetical protein
MMQGDDTLQFSVNEQNHQQQGIMDKRSSSLNTELIIMIFQNSSSPSRQDSTSKSTFGWNCMSTTAKHWPWETDTAGNEGAQ